MSAIKKRPCPDSIPSTFAKHMDRFGMDLLVSTFSDRIQVLISQKDGKVGTMMNASHEFSQIDNSHTYHIETLLGERSNDLYGVFARQILERIVKLGDGMNCPPLLLGITLTSKCNPEDFKVIVDEVVAMYQQAIQKVAQRS